MKPKQVYNTSSVDAVQQDSPSLGPRHVRQVYNYRNHDRKKARDNMPNQNFADQVMQLTSLVTQGDSFVRSVTFESNKVPSVLLFTDKTMELLQACCVEGLAPSVLGVDRTYNLGEVYVTATCFQHRGLVTRDKNEVPVMVGPILLHGNSSHDIYVHLFSKLACILTPTQVSSLVVGSDDELALRKAISEALPACTSIVCYRHVKNAVIRRLQDEVGLNESDRRRVLRLLFGDDGLLHAPDDSTFREKAGELKKCVQLFTGTEKFTRYMSQFLEDVLLNGIIKPSQKIGIEPIWTNNNCESVNHALKSMLGWKKVDLPSLVQALRQLICSQEREVERAILGVGNYTLTKEMKHYQVGLYEWNDMSASQRARKLADFIRNKRKRAHCVLSTDLRLDVMSSPAQGRKPGEPRHKKPKKCTTIKFKSPRDKDLDD